MFFRSREHHEDGMVVTICPHFCRLHCIYLHVSSILTWTALHSLIAAIRPVIFVFESPFARDLNKQQIFSLPHNERNIALQSQLSSHVTPFNNRRKAHGDLDL
jgi:hypothetical protein